MNINNKTYTCITEHDDVILGFRRVIIKIKLKMYITEHFHKAQSAYSLKNYKCERKMKSSQIEHIINL